MRHLLYITINIIIVTVGVLALTGKIDPSPFVSIFISISSMLVNCTSLILKQKLSKEAKKRRRMFWIALILWVFIWYIINLTSLEGYLNTNEYERVLVLLIPWMGVPILGMCFMIGILEAKEN